MAAQEWVVIGKHADGTYREVYTPAGARPVVEHSFEALEACAPQDRVAEMYTIRAADIDTWILVPQGDRPTNAVLVNVLPDGSLQRGQQRQPDDPGTAP
jgi:hypothetical protein